jgi:hypothetical protein
MEVFNNELYITVLFDGNIYSYNIIEKKLSVIGGSGKGPFEYNNPNLVISDNFLYVNDLVQSKISKFDLINKKFVNEYILDKFIGSPLVHIEKFDNKHLFYFIPIVRDRTKSNNTFSTLISFDLNANYFDTVFSYVDLGRLNYWDINRKADYSFEALMYTHRQIGSIGNKLAFGETNEFNFKFINYNNHDFTIDYNYLPDYSVYVNDLYVKIEGLNNSPKTSKKALQSALKYRRSEYDSKFMNWISSESYVLFKLFSKSNSYLLYDLNNHQNKILCADANYTPKLMDNTWIYWLKMDSEFQFEIVRTKIVKN